MFRFKQVWFYTILTISIEIIAIKDNSPKRTSKLSYHEEFENLPLRLIPLKLISYEFY